ncbi:MAG: DnaJ domain-containing protein [Cyanobacteria bacterium SZAS LIN-3]|nr:DnaJ domain-containing protein [Cyanobacteria bacterium SZAS LIN-3]MBS2005951.1 DnaJ domain-containing protein [Cyanobacteria bacterium SZAS TMP-1]
MAVDDNKKMNPAQSNSSAGIPAKDFYYILGVPPNATTEEISEAYHALYEKFGPHSGTEMDEELQARTIKDLKAAYETLSDQQRRRDYDKNSATFRQTSDVRSLWNKVTSGVQQVVASREQATTLELKGVASGKMHQPQAGGKIQALPLEMELEVTLKEAVKGCHRQLTITDPKACEECVSLKPVNRMQCTSCRGVGYFNTDRHVELDLPKGLYDDMEIRKTGQGKWDMRANAYGDLVIKIKIRKHPVLGILGRDITVNVPVTLYEAMLGAEIEVPTATGRVVMKIQPLTQPGRVYRLKGLGLAGADQLLTIDVIIPDKLTAEEVLLFQKLKQMSKAPNPREALFTEVQSVS